MLKLQMWTKNFKLYDKKKLLEDWDIVWPGFESSEARINHEQSKFLLLKLISPFSVSFS